MPELPPDVPYIEELKCADDLPEKKDHALVDTIVIVVALSILGASSRLISTPLASAAL
jgi:hypothetical protein